MKKIKKRVINMSSTYRSSEVTDLLSILSVINKCSIYSKIISTTKLYRWPHCWHFERFIKFIILLKILSFSCTNMDYTKFLVTCLVSDCSVWTGIAVSIVQLSVPQRTALHHIVKIVSVKLYLCVRVSRLFHITKSKFCNFFLWPLCWNNM